jgi:tryptophan synthase alpha chain
MIAKIRRYTNLPVAVGFGISTPEQARLVAAQADAVVVGSAVVNQIAAGGATKEKNSVLELVKQLARAIRQA